MEKYSKKLVSKCIYIQILKNTETELLGQFMAANGWNLCHTWLNDGVTSMNWAFVQEIIEMLLLCPVDGNRLKSNHTPRIVKNLSMNQSQNSTITTLSKKLVEQWLKIAHQEKQLLQKNGINNNNNNNSSNGDDAKALVTDVSETKVESKCNNNIENYSVNSTANDEELTQKSQENVKYKVSNKEAVNGLVLSIKRSTSPNVDEQDSKVLKSPDIKSKSEHKSKSSSPSDKDKEKSKRSSSHSSSHKSSSSSKSSHRDKERSSSSSSSHKSSSKNKESSSRSSKSSSSSSSRDKDKDRDKKKKDIEKEQAEKDKETLSFLAPMPSAKLQRIPKRPHSDSSESETPGKNGKTSEIVERKKPSISIETRKGDKPKTVKTLNSQFRNHGLGEEPPPPPSRKTLKKPATNIITLPPSSTTAVSSPSTTIAAHSTKTPSPPPSKKLHLDKAFEPDVPERTGGIKLIKPKREYPTRLNKFFFYSLFIENYLCAAAAISDGIRILRANFYLI